MIFLVHPYSMIALRHWRISRIEARTAAMMAERYAVASGRAA
jgi:hypothetical protein